jgi:hydrogenase maturation protease
MKKKTAVIAIGNELMGDDGVGPAVLCALEGHVPEGVECIDGGIGGFSLLHSIKEYDRVIFIDSGDFGGVPGEIKVFAPEEALSKKEMQRYSLHEADLLEILNISKKLGEAPEIIRVVTVQPKTITMGAPLSLSVRDAIPYVVKRIIEEIEKMR